MHVGTPNHIGHYRNLCRHTRTQQLLIAGANKGIGDQHNRKFPGQATLSLHMPFQRSLVCPPVGLVGPVIMHNVLKEQGGHLNR